MSVRGFPNSITALSVSVAPKLRMPTSWWKSKLVHDDWMQLQQQSTLNKEFVYGRHGASSLARRWCSFTAATKTCHRCQTPTLLSVQAACKCMHALEPYSQLMLTINGTLYRIKCDRCSVAEDEMNFKDIPVVGVHQPKDPRSKAKYNLLSRLLFW